MKGNDHMTPAPYREFHILYCGYCNVSADRSEFTVVAPSRKHYFDGAGVWHERCQQVTDSTTATEINETTLQYLESR